METTPSDVGRDGSKLFINVDGVSDSGPLSVELLDDQSRPIPQFSVTHAAKISAAGGFQDFIWPATRSSDIDPRTSFSARVSLPANEDARVLAICVGK